MLKFITNVTRLLSIVLLWVVYLFRSAWLANFYLVNRIVHWLSHADIRSRKSEILNERETNNSHIYSFRSPYVSRETVILNFCACTYGRFDESASGGGGLTGVTILIKRVMKNVKLYFVDFSKTNLIFKNFCLLRNQNLFKLFLQLDLWKEQFSSIYLYQYCSVF